jgi:hypothetical protein
MRNLGDSSVQLAATVQKLHRASELCAKLAFTSCAELSFKRRACLLEEQSLKECGKTFSDDVVEKMMSEALVCVEALKGNKRVLEKESARLQQGTDKKTEVNEEEAEIDRKLAVEVELHTTLRSTLANFRATSGAKGKDCLELDHQAAALEEALAAVESQICAAQNELEQAKVLNADTPGKKRKRDTSTPLSCKKKEVEFLKTALHEMEQQHESGIAVAVRTEKQKELEEASRLLDQYRLNHTEHETSTKQSWNRLFALLRLVAPSSSVGTATVQILSKVQHSTVESRIGREKMKQTVASFPDQSLAKEAVQFLEGVGVLSNNELCV